MYRVTKEIRFCYGHRLLDYEGPCRHLHGHNGRIEVTFQSDSLDSCGMVIDFDDIKRAVKGWVDENLDHRMLMSSKDELLPWLEKIGEPYFVFEGNPTAENIARTIFEHTKGEGHPIVSVRLWETDTSFAEYTEPEAGRDTMPNLVA